MAKNPKTAQTIYNDTAVGQNSTSTYSAWISLGKVPFTTERVIFCATAGGQYGQWQLGVGPSQNVVMENIGYNNTGNFVNVPLELSFGTDLYYQASANGANNIAIGMVLFPKIGNNQTIKRLIGIACNIIGTGSGWSQLNTSTLPTGNGLTKGIYWTVSTDNGQNTQFQYSVGYGVTSPPTNVIFDNMVTINIYAYSTIGTYFPFEFLPDGQNLWATNTLGGGTMNPAIYLGF
jgi:hypothetical protein